MGSKYFLLIALSSCARDDTPSSASKNTCSSNIFYLGTYLTNADTCLRRESLQEACTLYLTYPGLPQTRCPSFSEYAAYVLQVAEPQTQGLGSAERCIADGIPYDVVEYSPFIDRIHTDAIFSADGALVSYEYTNPYWNDRDTYCCNGHDSYSLLWGRHVALDCTHATTYTAADFPPLPDTGTSQTTDTSDTDAP